MFERSPRGSAPRWRPGAPAIVELTTRSHREIEALVASG